MANENSEMTPRANGDTAQAAGMEIVKATDPWYLGYDEINRTRDYIAQESTATREYIDEETSQLRAEGFGPGDIIATAAVNARAGWLMCTGQSLLRADYQALYDAIGTTYGAGDNFGGANSTFAVPNLQNRVPVGSGTSFARGATGGEITTVLTHAQLPNKRGVRWSWGGEGNVSLNTNPQAIPSASSANGLFTYQNNPEWDENATSGGKAHNNMPPYLVINYMIHI